MGIDENSQLLVAYSRNSGVFHGSLGARLALALPAEAFEVHFHPPDVPHCDHRIHG